MIHGIDHIVIISANLDDAITNAREAGFTVIPGGTHADGATHNALIAFTDGAYIELIAPTNGIEGKDHRWFPRLASGGGLVDMCLFSDDLATDVNRIGEKGCTYIGPVDNGRARLDGVELKWRGAFPGGAVGESGQPFLIEDVTPRRLRVSDDPAQTTHANGATGIAGVTVLTSDLAASTRDYEAITGLTAQTMSSPLEDTPIAAFITFARSWIMLTRPTAGEALHALERNGRGPYAVTLRTHDGPITPGEGRKIPAELMSGTVMELD
ncbi:MAG: VOC family protein [Thermomicrobiales bacterium]|nr:VOC family protein [Thermomicrobiales bacterium]